MTIKLSKEDKISITEAGSLYPIMQRILMRSNKIDRNKEHFWLVCLSTSNEILNIELISLGSINAVGVTVTDIFSFALHKRAVKVIMVHNHPSGNLKPSESDKMMTEKMLAVGFLINIPVLDHLIINEVFYYSFLDSGLLEKIKKSSVIDLTFQKQEMQQKELKKLKEKLLSGFKKQKITIAKQLFKDGVSMKSISKATGLTSEELVAALATKKEKVITGDVVTDLPQRRRGNAVGNLQRITSNLLSFA